MCRVLQVSRSGFYAWLAAKPSNRAQEDERLKIAIKAAHIRTKESYSARRLQPELAAEGFIAGRDRIIRLRKELDISCIQKRHKFKVTTNSKHDLPIAENLLNQDFNTKAPDKVWVADITYIPTKEGWLYLSGIKDLFNCEIVGYAMSARMTQDLTAKALFSAVKQKRPSAGLIHHSDRGSQYCASNYQKILQQFGITPSMSGKGNCYDNAPMESFWGTLKNELVHHQEYKTREEAKASIQQYIEIFYNRQRRHLSLGNISPAAFMENYNKIQNSLELQCVHY